jgi:hypothetical protein
MGDFNINLLNFDSHSLSENFINTLSSYFFQPHILQPTRITSHTATLIDNIFLNTLDYSTISGHLLCDISDHLPNFLLIKQISCHHSKEKTYRRDYCNLNHEILINEFKTIDWCELFYGKSNVNQLFGLVLFQSHRCSK